MEELEMLMDKFHTQIMTEFLLDEITFAELYKTIKDAAKTFLKSKGIDSKLRRSVYGALKGCNRRAYVEKFSMLLENWNVTTQDHSVILNEIKEIRDKITHEARYTLYNQEQLQHVIRTYKDLMSILAKVFLAMLNFKKGYHDPWQDHWISEPT